MTLLLGFGFALLISTLSMPLIIKYAHSRKLYDSFSARKIHSGNIPRLGGLGIFASFASSILLAAVVTGFGFNGSRWVWTVLGSMIIVFTVGLIDDFQDIRARFKLLLELTAAMIMMTQGFGFVSVILPLGIGVVSLGVLGPIITFFWIIGVTNAINLIDGMDGLAGGIASLVAVTCGLFFLARNNDGAALICFALFGAVLGFLFFNLHPAKIFMGDSGALFLGFSLAALPLVGPALGKVEISLVPAITMLIIPIFDTLSAMLRRLRAGVSIFSADRLHLHHKILDLGFSTRGTLGVILSAQAFLCLVSLSYLFLPINVCFFLNTGSWVVFVALFLGVERLAERKRELAYAQLESALEDVEKEKRERVSDGRSAIQASFVIKDLFSSRLPRK